MTAQQDILDLGSDLTLRYRLFSRASLAARRLCDCGEIATTRHNIGGVSMARCVDCTCAAEAQARSDVAEAL